MAHQKKLTEFEISDLLEVEDDDELGSLSVDDEDGDSDGPEEFEEIILPLPHTLPHSHPSPGSQDMFIEPLSPESQQLVDELPSPSASPSLERPIDELLSPAASASKEPPAKRRRLQSRQQPSSGKGIKLIDQKIGTIPLSPL